MRAIRVVLVDDSEEFLMGASSWIRSEPSLALAGTSRSGEEALDMAEQIEIDLVLMDAAMPGMNGFEATRKLKSRPRPPRVVILTFHDTAAAREAAREAGADDFVSKSEISERLMPVIRVLFDEGTSRYTDPAVPAATSTAAPAVKPRSRPHAALPGAPDARAPKRNPREQGGSRGE